MTFLDALATLSTHQWFILFLALVVAFGFEFINGFHDTANAVTTVIYTHTLPAYPAVIYSGILNFLGVLLGGTTVAFTIVNLLPVDLLVDSGVTNASLVMVLSLLLSGVIWNLGTWYLGLPVSSSHTLIGSILGVGLANGLMNRHGLHGVQWNKALEVGIALLVSPVIGFISSYVLLIMMKRWIKNPKLYVPPEGKAPPPGWVRAVLILTCGGVSFAHGSNDGQKGMGLIVLVLIGFLPFHYALNTEFAEASREVHAAAREIQDRLIASGDSRTSLLSNLSKLDEELANRMSFNELPSNRRWEVRQAIFQVTKQLKADEFVEQKKVMKRAIEFVPLWVKVGVALALGIGTTIGYQRIVITVAEKIGKTHLTYAQGASAEIVAAITIQLADLFHAPVSTTQVLSSGIAGTMAANGSGIQGSTCKKILLAWVFTLPSTLLLSGLMFVVGQRLFG